MTTPAPDPAHSNCVHLLNPQVHPRAHQLSRSEQPTGGLVYVAAAPRTLTWRVSPATNIVCPGTVSPARPEAKALANLPPSAEPRATSHSREHTACAHRASAALALGAAFTAPPPWALCVPRQERTPTSSSQSGLRARRLLGSLFGVLFLKKNIFIYLLMGDRERGQTQEEGEAGSVRGARCGTRSRDSRTTPWAEGGAKPLRHPGIPCAASGLGSGLGTARPAAPLRSPGPHPPGPPITLRARRVTMAPPRVHRAGPRVPPAASSRRRRCSEGRSRCRM